MWGILRVVWFTRNTLLSMTSVYHMKTRISRDLSILLRAILSPIYNFPPITQKLEHNIFKSVYQTFIKYFVVSFGNEWNSLEHTSINKQISIYFVKLWSCVMWFTPLYYGVTE